MRATILSLLHFVALAMLVSCASVRAPAGHAELTRQVMETERAFAKTMVERDFAAFKSFIADDAVFFAGTRVLHGKREVADAWQRLYEKPVAPFSWAPEQVEVLASGTLALSTGPVRDGSGKPVATFTSVWRAESPGVWRIVFDKGNDACDCAKP